MDFYMLDPGGLALQRCYFSDLNVVYPQVHDIRALIEFEPHTPSIQTWDIIVGFHPYTMKGFKNLQILVYRILCCFSIILHEYVLSYSC